MYPRLANAIDRVFLCVVVYVECATGVNIRTQPMTAAYIRLKTMLQSFFIDHQGHTPIPVNLGELHCGMSCVVVQHGDASRGEIMNYDFEGYCDVLLVDTGERIYAELHCLYHPESMMRMIAALSIECSLRGLAHIDDRDAAVLITEACVGEVFGRLQGHEDDGTPSIRLLNNELMDVGLYVVERLAGDVINYDPGLADEGFIEDPLADEE